ncbi:zinc ribbon domain-containing protein [uncultured Bacteroides sp.]|uniref:zinc ribbon domain-containing protein n=1 Tax=uncultured Bacteroides sp. TaxID=162156 RepID=UPI002AA7D9E6|nr:zinc ribbon domain-containing protein [uncultured Bacteroides sp.]
MALIKCPECGESVSDKAPSCPHCGLAIAGKIVRCPECDFVVPKDAVSCPKCAFPLKEVKDVKENAPTQQVVYKEKEQEQVRKEQEIARIEPAFSEARRLFEKKSFIEAYNKINVALHASPNNPECLNLEEAIIDAIRENSYNLASDLLQEKQYAKALAEVESGLQYAPNSQKLTVLADEIKSAKSRRRTRRTIITIIIALAIIGSAAYSIRDSYIKGHEEEAWTEAKDSATVSSLESFIELYPDGVHSMEAQELLESIKKKDTDYWNKICNYGDASMFKEYKTKFPKGLYLAQADTKIDSLDWVYATQKNTAEAYTEYLSTHPEGTHSSDALSAQNKIESTKPSEEDVTTLKSYFSGYYSAVVEKDDNSVLEFFEPVTRQYYGIPNAKKGDIMSNLKKMHSKDTRQPSININDENFKVVKDESGNYNVTFTISVSYAQEDESSASSSNMLVNAVVNQNKKITSITSRKQ